MSSVTWRKRTAGATVPDPPVGYLPCLMGDGRLRPMTAILLCQMACYGGIIRCQGKGVNRLRGPPIDDWQDFATVCSVSVVSRMGAHSGFILISTLIYFS
ncbi:hypothetical protein CDAR_436531 [Caerostris darwini]|uniref:Uncharacterized protein n=1 Tax=Caerostris darwini TaxID=1538125 RepID=A0AAV4R6R9_9ARAC|nr:hypothetical protein CDAR_436531 [Caerostris darwini]